MHGLRAYVELMHDSQAEGDRLLGMAFVASVLNQQANEEVFN